MAKVDKLKVLQTYASCQKRIAREESVSEEKTGRQTVRIQINVNRFSLFESSLNGTKNAARKENNLKCSDWRQALIRAASHPAKHQPH